MAKTVQAFTDNRGQIHTSAEQAVLSDITFILGRLGGESGITSGIAQRLLEKREEIRQAFAEFDALTGGGQ